MQATYLMKYIQKALSEERLEAPDRTQVESKYDYEGLSAVWEAHKRGGSSAAHTAWETVKALIPTLADLDLNLRLPANMNILGSGNGWYVVHGSELAKLPKVPFLIEGKIPAKGLTVLYGSSGVYKSFLALDYALTIAQGFPVVYMAGEGEYGYHQRMMAWSQHNHKTLGDFYMCIGAVPVLEPIEVSTFVDVLKGLNPALVVIDTLARSMVGGDENSARDMGLFVKACYSIQNQFGCATLLIHHTSKGGNVERGSGSLRGAADSMIRMELLEENLVSVESAKTKDAKPFPTETKTFRPIQVIVDGEAVDSGVLIPAEKIKDDPNNIILTRQQIKVLEHLSMELYREDGDNISGIMESTNTPRGSLARVLNRLLVIKYIEQRDRGAPYRITDAGLKAIAEPETRPLESVESHESHESHESSDS